MYATVKKDKSTILIVDDTPTNLKVLVEYLSRFDFKIRVAEDGEDALEQIALACPDLILLDINMPGIDGYETCKRLKAQPSTCDIPIIFMSALHDAINKVKAFEVGGIDYITKPFEQEEVLARVNTHLKMQRLQREVQQQNQTLEETVTKRTHELEQTRMQLITSLGKAAEYRDNETGMHVLRMSYCAKRIGEQMGLDTKKCNLIKNATPMHDIGKIGIPDNILTKPAKLTAQEWRIMQSHTVIGEGILKDHDALLLQTAADVARSHHERWDGTGYPDGLKGNKISQISRITSVADVFDALLSERPYKKAWSVEDTVTYIKAGAGQQFDPQVIDAFKNCLDDLLQIETDYCD